MLVYLLLRLAAIEDIGGSTEILHESAQSKTVRQLVHRGVQI